MRRFLLATLACLFFYGLLATQSGAEPSAPLSANDKTPSTEPKTPSTGTSNSGSGKDLDTKGSSDFEADAKLEKGPDGEQAVSEISANERGQASRGGGSTLDCVDLDKEENRTGEDKKGVDDDFITPVTDFDLDRRRRQDEKIAFQNEDQEIPLDSGRVYSPTGKWVYLTCTNAASEVVIQTELVPVGGPPVSLFDLTIRAIGVLDPPLPPVNVNPINHQLVQLPTLFWVEPAYWDAQRTDTQTAGRVFLTMTLTPELSTWEPGDNTDPVTCQGPGEVWEPKKQADEDYKCQHIYRTVQGQPFTLIATVDFAIGLTTNAPETLTLPNLQRTTETEIEVQERQVVETN